MDPRRLIEENVDLIDRLVRRACARVGIAAGDADDVASSIKLALVENDYAILRRFEGRSTLATYLTMVIQRLMADEYERRHGRWRPSPEAQRLGPVAMLIEDLVSRQRRSLEEALPIVRTVDAAITQPEAAAIVERLPRRMPRAREIELPEAEAMPHASADRADEEMLDRELRELSRRAGLRLCDEMNTWPAEDRLLMRLRFESSLTIAEVARLLNVPQRPLYRRLQSRLARLRDVLLEAGIGPSIAEDLLAASPRVEIDFGALWKSGDSCRTNEGAERAARQEQSS